MVRPTDEQRKMIAVTAMAEMFNRPISQAAVKMFVSALKDIPAADVERAATAAIQTCEFMPVPSKIIELSGAGGTPVGDRAILAWMAVERAVASIGAYRTVDFDDKIINAAIRSLGGWAALCARSGVEFDKWAKKDFASAYEALVRSGVSAEMAAPLPGLGGAGMVRMMDGSYVEHKPVVQEVVTGLPWAGEPVKNLGHQPAPRRVTKAPLLELKKPGE